MHARSMIRFTRPFPLVARSYYASPPSCSLMPSHYFFTYSSVDFQATVIVTMCLFHIYNWLTIYLNTSQNVTYPLVLLTTSYLLTYDSIVHCITNLNKSENQCCISLLKATTLFSRLLFVKVTIYDFLLSPIDKPPGLFTKTWFTSEKGLDTTWATWQLYTLRLYCSGIWPTLETIRTRCTRTPPFEHRRFEILPSHSQFD
jgi:hypothetical protein